MLSTDIIVNMSIAKYDNLDLDKFKKSEGGWKNNNIKTYNLYVVVSL